jgi:hypothetical protein
LQKDCLSEFKDVFNILVFTESPEGEVDVEEELPAEGVTPAAHEEGADDGEQVVHDTLVHLHHHHHHHLNFSVWSSWSSSHVCCPQSHFPPSTYCMYVLYTPLFTFPNPLSTVLLILSVSHGLTSRSPFSNVHSPNLLYTVRSQLSIIFI